MLAGNYNKSSIHREGRSSRTKIFKKSSRDYLSENRIIGVIGLGRSVGVTHLCVMMANYLTGACGKSTAMLEWGNQGAFKKVEQICTGKKSAGESYRLLDVDYYPESGPRELASCLSSKYQHVIIDFGEMKEEKKTEILRCDNRIVVASFSEWQMDAFWEFYQKNMKAEKNGWIYLAVFGSEETRIEIKKRLKLSFVRVPLSIDAFTIDREMMTWFDQMFAHHR